MAHGWEGDKVRLVPLDAKRHLANALLWLNDPEVTAWTLTGDWPVTRLAEDAYFERVERGGEHEAGFAVETLTGDHIGFTAIHDIDHRHGSARTGMIIGVPGFWGQGYATDTVRVRTRYAFEVLGLRLLLSEVIDGNTASVRMLERGGYREVGRVPRRYFKRGSFRDAILFALEREG